MKVKKLCLQNYGRFDDLEMEFAPNNEIKGNVTIIVGNNGAGKSQILQALATGFSWFVNELVFKNNQNQYVLTKQSNNEYLSLPDEGDFICQHQIKNNKKTSKY